MSTVYSWWNSRRSGLPIGVFSFASVAVCNQLFISATRQNHCFGQEKFDLSCCDMVQEDSPLMSANTFCYRSSAHSILSGRENCHGSCHGGRIGSGTGTRSVSDLSLEVLVLDRVGS
jgi:hypothetical protein